MKILTPASGSTVSLLTEKQKQFIAAEEYRKTVSGDLIFQWNNLSPQPGSDESQPQPVEVRWTPDVPATVTLSNGTAFRGKPGLLVWNLCPGTTYTLTVTADSGESDSVQFCTADEQPRFLRVDGLTNVRDVGGWKTRDGRRIRYGQRRHRHIHAVIGTSAHICRRSCSAVMYGRTRSIDAVLPQCTQTVTRCIAVSGGCTPQCFCPPPLPSMCSAGISLR